MMEDFKEARAMKTKEGELWRKSLTKNMSARLLGNSLVYSSLATGFYSATSMFTGMVNMLLPAVVDDENLPTENEMLGASMMFQHLDYYKAGLNYNPIAYKDGDRMYALDGMRMDYHGALAVVPDGSRDPNRITQLMRLPASLFLSGGNSNIVQQVSDAAKGVDWRGKDIKDDVSYYANLLKTMGSLLIPGGGREVNQAYTSRSWFSGKRSPDSEFILKFGGVRVKSFDTKELISNIGNQIGLELSLNNVTSQLIKEISLGDRLLNTSEIISIVKQDIANNRKLDNEYGHFVDGAELYGYKKSQIVKMLSKKETFKGGVKTFMTKDSAKQLVYRGTVFNENAYKKIGRAISLVKKRRIKPATYTREDKSNAIRNLQSLQRQYRNIMREIKRNE